MTKYIKSHFHSTLPGLFPTISAKHFEMQTDQTLPSDKFPYKYEVISTRHIEEVEVTVQRSLGLKFCRKTVQTLTESCINLHWSAQF